MFRSLLILPLALPLTACSPLFAHVAADSTADVMEAASPSLEHHFDVALFGKGLPAMLLQMEGVHVVSPDKRTHTVELAKAYCLYTYGWVEDDYEKAELAGDLERADKIRKRAVGLYLRGRDFGLEVMRYLDSDVDEVLAGDVETLRKYLKRRYHGERETHLLFWTAMAWGSAINIGRDNPELIAELATVKALAERAVALDPTYYHGAPLALLGAIEAALPAAMGGDPQAGKDLYEQAIAVTDRQNLVLLVQYARTYAMVVGDRPLYEKLLNEVVDAPEDYGGDELRLPNAVALARAQRYLESVDAEM